MTIQNSNLAHLASKVMDDVPEGGGGPSSTVIPWGQSNGIFDDITEVDRAGGDVSIRQLFSVVRTTGVERFLDANIIVSHPPTDPNVSITLAACGMFARRTDIAQAIANYLIPNSEWNGFLLENHVAGQRSIQICHRPGTPAPNDGRTLLLIHDEGKVTETQQYVRVISSETTERTFTYNNGGQYVDFQASVTECKLQDALRIGFKGSPPSRLFARAADGAAIRDTTVADAATFFGASTMTAAASLGNNVVRLASIYTQIVPNSRTESVALDQKPAAQRLLTLASSPRQVDVGVTPHSQRIRVTQENRSYSWTAMLRPLPAPGTIVASYMAQGRWYTVIEDPTTVTENGGGTFTGSGVGTVNYLTGSMGITLPVPPDVGSSIIISWGEKSAYTNRSGQAGYRAPEFSWGAPHAPFEPGSVVVKWPSGGVLQTATDNGVGGFGGGVAGEINYAAAKISIRPTAMIDAGGEFHVDYRYTTTRTENFTNLVVDAGGFAAITLQEAPAPHSLKLEWATVRNVSASAGASDFVSSNGTDQAAITETRTQTVFAPTPPTVEPPTYTAPTDGPSRVFPVVPSPMGWEVGAIAERRAPGQKIHMVLNTSIADGNGAFRWVLVPSSSGGSLESAFPTLSGTVYVANNAGYFDIPTLATTPADVFFNVRVEQELGGAFVAISPVTQTIDVQEVPATETLPTYTTTQIQGFYNRYIFPGEKRWATFTGPVPAGAYLWDIVTQAPTAFEAISGSFTVSNGDGGFWVNAKDGATPSTTFTVRVKKPEGAVLATCGELQIVLSASQQNVTPPPAAIKVRDPISTSTTKNTSGAVSVAGMFAGGVDGTGKTIYVAVAPSTSEQWGAYYDPPASESELWTSAQIAVRSKPLKSVNGLTINYQIWGG